MDYLRQQRLAREAEEICPNLGAELSSRPLTPAEMDEIDDTLKQFRAQMASHDVLQAQHRRQADEYRRETDRLEKRTAALGLNAQLLPPAGQAAARHLGSLASGLGLHTAEEGPMTMAFVAQDMEGVREEREQARRREEAESLKAAAESLSRLSRQLGAELDRALGAQAVLLGGVGRVQADTALLDAKARDYVDRFVELQGKLMRMGFKEELSHSALVELSGQVEVLERSLASERQALEEYGGVPPSVPGLGDMLTRAQQELDAVMRQVGRAFVG